MSESMGQDMGHIPARALFSAFLVCILAGARPQDHVRCLTGNARRPGDNAASKGSYSVLMPGLTAPGWPRGPAQQDVPFEGAVLTDGNLDTLLEWSDGDFGRFGRDVVVDLGTDRYIDRVEASTKGNRLSEGTLWVKPEGGKTFVPILHSGREEFADPGARRLGRSDRLLFPGVGVVARHLRLNVRGNHDPRLSEVEVWGRAPAAADRRPLVPLLAYDPSGLSEPKKVEQVPPPDPARSLFAGEHPRFEFRAVRLLPPHRNTQEINRRLVRALAALRFNRVIHEGLEWGVNLDGWKTRYGQAVSVEELREAIRFNGSLGLKTSGSWAIAPAPWTTQLGDPALVEGRPGEVVLERGRIDFKRYPGETLRQLSRVNPCPLQPRNLETFKKVIDELMTIYSDEYFLGGVDEPLQWYNGSRWACCERCQGRDPVQLMADWVNQCSDHIRKKHGRTHLYQSTILLEEHQGVAPGYPGGPEIRMYTILDRMPKDRVALVNWSYDVWRRRKGAEDSSGLNRYLAKQGFGKILQNVGYDDASFAICEFVKWAGIDGADFMGASVANYGDQSLDDMARRFKFLDYVVAALELWNPSAVEPSSRAFGSLLVDGLERVRETLEDVRLPSRAARPGSFFSVDLAPYANRSTVDERAFDGEGWVDAGPGLDLRALPAGKQTLCGIPFDLLDPAGGRSCVMLESASRADRTLPSETRGIRIGRKASGLVFLHALTEAVERGATEPAFVYQVTYADGARARFPVRYRVEAMEWLDESAAGPGDLRLGWFLYGARPAWLGATRSGRRAILYAAEWVNPTPEKEVESIDMTIPASSRASGAGLFAIAGVAAP